MYTEQISEMPEKSERLLPLLPDNDLGLYCREIIFDCRKWFKTKNTNLMWEIFNNALNSENDDDFSYYLDESDPLFNAVCLVCFHTVCYLTQAAIKAVQSSLPPVLDRFQDVDGLPWEPEFLKKFSTSCHEVKRLAKERGLSV